MKPFNPRLSLKLDYATWQMEAARGWRRTFWRLVKRWFEFIAL